MQITYQRRRATYFVTEKKERGTSAAKCRIFLYIFFFGESLEVMQK